MIKILSTSRPLPFHVVCERAYLLTSFHGFFDRERRQFEYSPMTIETSSEKSFSSRFGMFGSPSGVVYEMDARSFAEYDGNMYSDGYERKTLYYKGVHGEIDICQFYVRALPPIYFDGRDGLILHWGSLRSDYSPMIAVYVNEDSWLNLGDLCRGEMCSLSPFEHYRRSFDLFSGVILYREGLNSKLLSGEFKFNVCGYEKEG